jgi:hypothetical protein
LIQGSGNNEIVFRMELRAHCVMVVAGHSADYTISISVSNGRV